MGQKLDLSECQSCVCFAVRRAARAITQYYDRYLRPSGLRTTQFTLLALLAQTGEVSLNKAADRLGMERTTLTRNIRPLLLKSFITVSSGEDRRLRLIAITEKGLSAVRRALPYWRKAQRTVSGQVPSETMKTLAEVGRMNT